MEEINTDILDHEKKLIEIKSLHSGELKNCNPNNINRFNRFKAKFLGKDYAVTDKPNTLLGFTYWYAEHLREKKRLGNMTSFTDWLVFDSGYYKKIDKRPRIKKDIPKEEIAKVPFWDQS